jgi:FAD dependent monooxygenase
MSPDLPKPDEHYQVAIVGGGIAGLTLALALERIGVSFVLFEANESIAPDKGASVGFLPNGLRILDQLGLLGDFEKQSIGLKTSYHVDDNGELIMAHNGMGYFRSK